MLSANDKLCNLLDSCVTPEAPLCPLQELSLKTAIWYGDEPICQSDNFQHLSWIKKQKIIADLGLTADDGFFTVRMLNSLRTIGRNLVGADPSETSSEAKWFKERRKPESEKAVSNRKPKAKSKPAIKRKGPVRSKRLF
jgi:hypothetical protein